MFVCILTFSVSAGFLFWLHNKWMVLTSNTTILPQCHYKLQYLPARLHELPNLKRLIISNCAAVWSLPKDGLPSSLQELVINSCPAIRSLPKDGLPRSLQELVIDNCTAIQSLPKDCLPSSLQKLEINHCPRQMTSQVPCEYWMSGIAEARSYEGSAASWLEPFQLSTPD